MKLGVSFDFEKADAEGRYVRGWASVATIDGAAVTDWQGDQVEIDELRKAAHEFILDARVAKAMHRGSQIGDVVESIIIDDHLAKALGMTTDKRGWFIGMRLNDSRVVKRVQSGELRAFSIGGRGTRREI